MSVLPDYEIRALGAALINPFDPERVQPASYDLALADEILIPRSGIYVPDPPDIDLRSYDMDAYMIRSRLLALDGHRYAEHTKDGYILRPGRCILASTTETLRVPSDLVARVEGKSSIGRLFLTAHVTAGFIDSGFRGQVTLEICNLGPWRVLLRPSMKIAQVNFTRLSSSCERPYGSPGLGNHYQNQYGPTAGKS